MKIKKQPRLTEYERHLSLVAAILVASSKKFFDGGAYSPHLCYMDAVQDAEKLINTAIARAREE